MSPGADVNVLEVDAAASTQVSLHMLRCDARLCHLQNGSVCVSWCEVSPRVDVDGVAEVDAATLRLIV